MENDKISEFLRFSEPIAGSRRFVLGAFENRVTLYSQQVRALNLIYALHNEKDHEEPLSIAVIGGGVAGLTAAAAAAHLGMQAYVFERKPNLLSLQQGCDIRWLHPHIYDWPMDDTELPYAGLPVMDWEESTAGDVARQLLDEFKNHEGRVEVFVNVKDVVISDDCRIEWTDAKQWKGKQKSAPSPRNAPGERTFDAIIFAVGFGVEKHERLRDVSSYWRNDSLNQVPPDFNGERSTVVISGVGDGGLIDLLRACIDGFHQGRLLRELLPPSDRQLYQKIRSLVSKWKKTRPEPPWLFDEFTKLNEQGLFDGLRQTPRTAPKRRQPSDS